VRTKLTCAVLLVAGAAMGLLQRPLQAQFVYVPGTSVIDGYRENTTSGALTPLPGSPFSGPVFPSGPVVVHPSSRYAFLLDNTSLWEYRLNPATGALTPLPGTPFPIPPDPGCTPSCVTPTSLAVHPSGKFLYVTRLFNSILGLTFNPDTGALADVPGSPFLGPTFSTSVTLDPSGKFLFVVQNEQPFGTTVYSVNNATGALTEVFDIGSAEHFTRFVTVAPTGKFVYVANQFSITAYILNTSTGALTQSPGSPFNLVPSRTQVPTKVAVDPTGHYAYAGYSNGSFIAGFTINSANGALSAIPGSPFASSASLNYVAIDPGGKFVYATNTGSVTGARVTGATGALSSISGAPAAAGPNAFGIAFAGCTAPPIIDELTADPSVLWPPNHQLVKVKIGYQPSSQCGGDAPVCSLSVSSNEAPTTVDEWIIQNAHSVLVRAERAGGERPSVHDYRKLSRFVREYVVARSDGFSAAQPVKKYLARSTSAPRTIWQSARSSSLPLPHSPPAIYRTSARVPDGDAACIPYLCVAETGPGVSTLPELTWFSMKGP
jgi:6-phosphogluconolactonase